MYMILHYKNHLLSMNARWVSTADFKISTDISPVSPISKENHEQPALFKFKLMVDHFAGPWFIFISLDLSNVSVVKKLVLLILIPMIIIYC